jgi:hypothetical protein
MYGLAYQSIDERGAYCYDSVAEWTDITNEVLPRLFDVVSSLKDKDNDLYKAEIEHIEKGRCCWRVPGMGRLQFPKGLVVENEDQAEWLKPYFIKKAQAYQDHISSIDTETLKGIYNAGAVILDSGKGAPTWSPASDPLAAHMIASATSHIYTMDGISEWCRSISGWDPLITIYARIQASRKESPWYQVVGGKFSTTQEYILAKVRSVKAVPFVCNIRVAGIAHLHREMMKQITDRNTGTLGPAIKKRKDYNYAFASDLSTYDDTVSYQTKKVYIDTVIHTIADTLLAKEAISKEEMSLILEIAHYINQCDMLCPPIDAEFSAWQTRTKGAIKSGSRWTAVEGSDINDCRVQAEIEQRNLSDIDWVNFGDDLLVYSNGKQTEDVWFDDSYNKYGFVETKGDDASFLMRRINKDGSFYAYFSRMLLRTINREVHEEASNMLVAAMGTRTRYELLYGHPLLDNFFDILYDCVPKMRTAVDFSSDLPMIAIARILGHAVGAKGMNMNQRILGPNDIEDLIQIYGEDIVKHFITGVGSHLLFRSGMKVGEFKDTLDNKKREEYSHKLAGQFSEQVKIGRMDLPVTSYSTGGHNESYYEE